MVGFLLDPTIEEELSQNPFELSKSDNPLPLDDFSLSFADSLLDFDCLSDWIEENPSLDMADSNPGSEKVGSLNMEDKAVEGVCVGVEKAGSFRESNLGDGFQKLGDLSSSIEEEIQKFSLDADGIGVMSGQPESVSENVSKTVMVGVNGDGAKSGGVVSVDDNGKSKSAETVGIDESGRKSGEMELVSGDVPKSDETESDGDESDSTSDSDGSSSSSSTSSSSSEEEEEESEEEEKEVEEKELEGGIDMEEGEIRESDVEQMVAWSDDEDEDGSAVKGPIKSKNELQVLPPVPPVNVSLEPHHQTLPVGVILSILGTQVIVEGVEKHNPLSDGSILWITESRSPLGLVDEIFGPVKNPYYMIRYNSENEIPTGVKQGTPISFVPEFANHVLNDSNLYKKGYDASGENDEEVTDEAEFSDDEKEAEYKRMVKMSKRGTNGPNLGNNKKERKNFNNRGGKGQQNRRPPTPQTLEGTTNQPPANQNYQFTPPPLAASQDPGNCSLSFGTTQGFAGNPGLVPPFPQLYQNPGFIPSSSGVWTNGMPCGQQQQQLQLQGMVFPFGVPPNGMPFMQQNHPQPSYQMPLMNTMPFPQQFIQGQMLPPNVVSPGAQWQGCFGQNSFNQPMGMGWQSQQAPMSMNVGEQPCPLNQGNVEVPREFNQGTNRGRGRKPFHRGGGRFGGGRGQRQSK